MQRFIVERDGLPGRRNRRRPRNDDRPIVRVADRAARRQAEGLRRDVAKGDVVHVVEIDGAAVLHPKNIAVIRAEQGRGLARRDIDRDPVAGHRPAGLVHAARAAKHDVTSGSARLHIPVQHDRLVVHPQRDVAVASLNR